MAEQIMELLHELNRTDGQTIVLVTHDQGIGLSCPRLLRLRDGRIVSDERHVADGQWMPDSQRSLLTTGG
jgi:putative ABC transport system ATP-binding protein